MLWHKLGEVKKTSAPLIIVGSLPSLCQKSSKLVEIWHKFLTNTNLLGFWDTVYMSCGFFLLFVLPFLPFEEYKSCSKRHAYVVIAAGGRTGAKRWCRVDRGPCRRLNTHRRPAVEGPPCGARLQLAGTSLVAAAAAAADSETRQVLTIAAETRTNYCRKWEPGNSGHSGDTSRLAAVHAWHLAASRRMRISTTDLHITRPQQHRRHHRFRLLIKLTFAN